MLRKIIGLAISCVILAILMLIVQRFFIEKEPIETLGINVDEPGKITFDYETGKNELVEGFDDLMESVKESDIPEELFETTMDTLGNTIEELDKHSGGNNG